MLIIETVNGIFAATDFSKIYMYIFVEVSPIMQSKKSLNIYFR